MYILLIRHPYVAGTGTKNKQTKHNDNRINKETKEAAESLSPRQTDQHRHSAVHSAVGTRVATRFVTMARFVTHRVGIILLLLLMFVNMQYEYLYFSVCVCVLMCLYICVCMCVYVCARVYVCLCVFSDGPALGYCGRSRKPEFPPC